MKVQIEAPPRVVEIDDELWEKMSEQERILELEALLVQDLRMEHAVVKED